MNSRFELLFSVKLQIVGKHGGEGSPALFLTMKLDSSSQVVVEHAFYPRLKKSLRKARAKQKSCLKKWKIYPLKY